jgi:2-amino-4-hydroxy-6-hydroxymethyldihydropteridine diphosphokinase
MSREVVYIGFGSNEGDRLDHCDRALTLLGLLPGSAVTGVSSLYETEPVVDERTDPGGTWFLNGVVRLETEVAPRPLLAVCREIQQALGRDLDKRHGPRSLDLDILLYGQRIVREPNLTIPHPRLHRRRFVLEPLAELAPTLQHPLLKHSIRELLEQVTDPARVRRLEPVEGDRYGTRPSCSVPRPTSDSGSPR